MKNNLKPIKRHSYVVLVAIGAMLSFQSFAQRHSETRDGGGGGDHQRSFTPNNNGGGRGGNFTLNRGSNDNRSFPQESRPSATMQRPSRSIQPNRPSQNNGPAFADRSQNTQRPNREIVRNNNTTVNHTNVYNRQDNNYNRRGDNGYNRQGNNSYNRSGYNSYNRPEAFRNYHPIYNAHNPSWRYNSGYFPRRNTVINVFPYGYSDINYGGFGYRYYNGIYYRPYESSYIVCNPPFGLYINTLPFGYRRIYVNDNPYYYYNGTYYNQREDNNYQVVRPPLGAVVESIPEGYQTLTIDGETYYEVDGVQYKPVVQDNGEVWYQVIKVDGVENNDSDNNNRN
jgi:hypothetical protein